MKHKLSFIIVSILSIMDFFITKAVVAADMTLELNPIAAWAISNHGYLGLAILKLFPIILLGFLLFKLRREKVWIEFLLAMVAIIYATIVFPGILLL